MSTLQSSSTATHLVCQCLWPLEQDEGTQPKFNWATGQFAMEGLGSWLDERMRDHHHPEISRRVRGGHPSVVSLVHYDAEKQQPARMLLFGCELHPE